MPPSACAGSATKEGLVVTGTVAPAVEFEIVIGLEIHAQLITRSKMFCGCSAAAFASAPNTNICPVCMGMPGVLPVINREAIRQAVRVAGYFGSNVQTESRFDRKNYTYPDLPKGYQITQYALPIGLGGYVEFEPSIGGYVNPSIRTPRKHVRLTRIHLEEDTGQLVHGQRAFRLLEPRVAPFSSVDISLVDLNRAGMPLLEIVTEPDLRSPQDAYDFFKRIQESLRYIGASTGFLSQGAMRCDANISLRHRDALDLGAKVEIKNLNSYSSILNAMNFEVERQTRILLAGGTVEQETRGWSESRKETVGQRSKEYAHDYRYFPEPDLPPLLLSASTVQEWIDSLPENQDSVRHRFINVYGMNEADAKSLSETWLEVLDFEESLGSDRRPEWIRLISGIITNDLHSFMNDERIEDYSEASRLITPSDRRQLAELILSGAISRTASKQVFRELAHGQENAVEIIKRLGLSQTSKTDELAPLVINAINSNPRAVADYRSGKANAINVLIGAVMRESRGANSQVVRELLIQRLAAPE